MHNRAKWKKMQEPFSSHNSEQPVILLTVHASIFSRYFFLKFVSFSVIAEWCE